MVMSPVGQPDQPGKIAKNNNNDIAVIFRVFDFNSFLAFCTEPSYQT